MGGLCGEGVVRHAPEFISNVLYLCSFRDRLLSDSQSEHQYPCLPTINHSDLSPSCPALHCCYWSSGNRLVIITPSQTAHEASHSLAAAYLSSCVSSSAAECGTRLHTSLSLHLQSLLPGMPSLSTSARRTSTHPLGNCLEVVLTLASSPSSQSALLPLCHHVLGLASTERPLDDGGLFTWVCVRCVMRMCPVVLEGRDSASDTPRIPELHERVNSSLSQATRSPTFSTVILQGSKTWLYRHLLGFFDCLWSGFRRALWVPLALFLGRCSCRF